MAAMILRRMGWGFVPWKYVVVCFLLPLLLSLTTLSACFLSIDVPLAVHYSCRCYRRCCAADVPHLAAL